MDLLRSLIVPGTQAYAQWASSAVQRPNYNSTNLDDSNLRRDSVHGSHHLSQSQNSPDLAQMLDQLLEEGEVDETTVADQRSLRQQSTQDLDDTQAPGITLQPISEQTMGKQAFIPKNKLCFDWYHRGQCYRDPANPIKDGRLCPYVHSLKEGQDDIKMSPFRLWMHKGPCGLALCPLKDAEKPKKRSKKVTTEETPMDVSQNLHEQLPSALAKAPGETNAPQQQKKRKVPIRHRDEPMPSALKRQKITYDDEATVDSEVDQKDEICFFWYHGHCSRSLNPANNYRCEYKHELSDPPSMVPPPPGYDHSKSCGLKWCATEAKNTISDRQTLPKEDMSDSISIEVDGELQDQTYQHSGKPKEKTQRTKAKRTCFFWYHGHCKRGSESGEQPCPMRHELRDPPKMVEPPPGYVHREPCEREWCPGDAMAGMEGDEFNKRYFENNDVEGERSSDDEDGQEQDWYLTGFD